MHYEHWTTIATFCSLIGVACGSGGSGSGTDTDPTGTTSPGETDDAGSTTLVDPTDETSTGGTPIETDGDTDTDDTATDGCGEVLSDCPGVVGNCPVDLVGTDLVTDRILGLTCAPGCGGVTTSLELYDSITAQPTTLATTEPDVIPIVVDVASDGSVVVAGWYQPLAWEPPLAATLHRFQPDGSLSWTVQREDAAFHEMVLHGDDIIGIDVGADSIIAHALADGSPSWSVPLPAGLSAVHMTGGSDGTLYVVAWDGVAPLQGIHLLAFDPAHALQWDLPEDALPAPDEERRIQSMVVDETGQLVIAYHRTYLVDDNEAIEVRKIDAAGAELWSTTIDYGIVRSDSQDDRFFDIVARPGGGVIVVGRAANAGGSQPMAVGLDADGNELWSELGTPEMLARIQHGVRVGSDALGMGCGAGEWLAPYPP